MPLLVTETAYLSPMFTVSCLHVSTSIVASHTQLCGLYMVSSHNEGYSLFASCNSQNTTYIYWS